MVVIEWLKKNKWLFWLVPVGIAIIKGIDLLNLLRLKKAQSDLKDVEEVAAKLKESQAVHEALSGSSLNKANEIRDSIPKKTAEVSTDWHKDFKGDV